VAAVTPNNTARRLFAPIAPSYQRWASVLSLGQDGRWRRAMITGLDLAPGSQVLDVAAGTGSITRLLQQGGHRVVGADLSPAMLSQHPGPNRVMARGERLPFRDDGFDAVTFGYLLRYVDDPVACLEGFTRVLKPGGRLGMVEFGLPTTWYFPWRAYTDGVLPLAGHLIDQGWYEVGEFLRKSIEGFHRRHPDLEAVFHEAGFVDVKSRHMSLGGGLVMWARKP
jgi:demethylmenaquinone methyltransferase / 2-methoxy-6-polyprenyl-1,4-benzoquinol methylase